MPSDPTSAASDREEGLARTALRRELLLATRPDVALQDQIDCAALAIDAGLQHVGNAINALCALYGSGWINDPSSLQSDQPRDRQFALLAVAGARPFPFDQAIADLTTLIQLRPVLAPPGAALMPRLVGGIGPAEPANWMIHPEMLPLGERLLSELASARTRNEVCDLIKRARTDLLRLGPIALDQHVGMPLDLLGTMFVWETARRFIVANRNLICATAPVEDLLAQAVALDPAALGPCFKNVPLLIRTISDLLAMIDAAAGRLADRETIQTWCVLLSAHLRTHQLEDLVDELGDHGALAALNHILRRISAGPIARLAGPVHRIRDVALDLRDFGLAADAQWLLLQSRPYDSNEWKILGDIISSAEDTHQAVVAYERALLIAPSNLDARRNLALLKAGRLPPVTGGYSVTEGRRRLRLARASAYGALRPTVARADESVA